MKKIRHNGKIVLAAALLCTAWTACDDESEGFSVPTNSVPMEFSASYPVATRATDAGFTQGDRFGVYVVDYVDDATPGQLSASGNRASNVLFTFDEANQQWNGATDIYWKDETSCVDVYAYYPFDNQMEEVCNYQHSISTTQNDTTTSPTSLGGYESSDLLVAKTTGVKAADGKVNLTFNHLMACVVVTLQKGTGFSTTEWDNAAKSVLMNNMCIEGNIDLSTSTITPNEEILKNIAPYRSGDTYRAVVYPKVVAAATPIISIAVNEHSYELTKTESITLSSGKMHQFTITVNRRSEEGDYEFKVSDESITPWIDDEEFRDGLLRSYTIVKIAEPGTMQQVVANMGINPANVTNLKIEGYIDRDDAGYIRSAFSNITNLNLYDARFVNSYINSWSGEYEHYQYGWDYPDKIESQEELDNLLNQLTNNDDVIPGGWYENGWGYNMKLTHIILPKTLKGIGGQAFYGMNLVGQLNFPEGLIFIGEKAYQNCRATGELTLPSSLKFLGLAAFGCENAYGVTFYGDFYLPEGLIAIGQGAFASGNDHNFTNELKFPESLTFLGEGALGYCIFKGGLTIPQDLILGGSVSARFDGTLELPEGMTEIPSSFEFEAGFYGELKIPSTVLKIGSRAFGMNKFTKVIFPDNLKIIETDSFLGCRITGTVEIPDNVQFIKDYAFYENELLTGIKLGTEIKYIGHYAFADCPQICYIRVDAEEPPYIYENTFRNVNKDNVKLQVPENSIDAYKNHQYWGEFKHIVAYKNFVSDPDKICALNTMSRQTIVLYADGEWEVSSCPDWCTVSPMSGNKKTEVTVTINALPQGGPDRSEDIVFSLKGTDVQTTCTLSQYDYQYAEDEQVTLQTASQGNGELNVYFIGDGFDAQAIADGTYLDLAKEEMEYFFGIEPYTSMRDYFNVYASISMSQETGVNTTNTWRDTRFMTIYGSSSAGLTADVDLITDYMKQYTTLTEPYAYWGIGPKNIIIMLVNSSDYSGTTTMLDNGLAISICPPSTKQYPSDTRGTVQHEACGHGFGKLGDETISYNAFVPISVMATINSMHERGWYQNVSLNGKMSDVPWSHLIFDERYSDEVDIFEGAMGYTRGVYRCETNSCMNYGIPYFSAIARQDIMFRILDYAGEGDKANLDYFYEHDSKEWGSITTTRAAGPLAESLFQYMGSPVRLMKCNEVPKSTAKKVNQ